MDGLAQIDYWLYNFVIISLFKLFYLWAQESDRVTKDGFLVVQSAKTRSQMLNQADCLDRIRAVIRKAATKPSSPTHDELELVKRRFFEPLFI